MDEVAPAVGPEQLDDCSSQTLVASAHLTQWGT
jgi:hypothetical protein